MWKTTALTALTLGLSGVVAHADPDGLWQPQIRAIIGADNNGGNAALEGFIPIKQTAESVLFLDVRAKHDFKDASGQDIGLGIRRIVNPDLMLGGYAYINVENYNSTQFTAGTLGVEAITPNFDAHVNVFIPIKGDSTDHSVSSSLSMVSNQLIEQISVLDHRDYAAWGIEGEVGAKVPINLPDKHSLRLDIGGYHFEDPHGDDGSVTGAKAGFEYTIGDVFGSGTELVLAGEVRDDNRDHTQFAGSVRLNIPFNPGHGSDTTGAISDAEPVYPVSEGLRKRVNERVRGDIGVRVQSQDLTGGSTTRVAINAATNAAFGKFYYADGVGAGTGTLAAPTTLDSAVAQAGTGGFVVALGGNGNLTTAGVTLANGQTVIGGGESVTAKLFGGGTATFNLGGSDGTIQGTNVANNVITLGNGNTLNGITITGGADGIFGNNVTGTTLTNVTVTGAGANGAEFTGNSTNVSASGFTATGNGLDGLHIQDNGTYNFTGTTLLQSNLDDGLDVTGQGTYTFATLNAQDNHDAGITVKGTSVAGSFTTTGGQVSGNQALGDDGVSVFIDPITAHVVLDSITQTGGTSGVALDHVSGSFTVNGATTISNTTGPAIAISDSPATIRFGDINITNPGTDGISFSGVNAAVVAGNIVISGLGVGTGLDFSGSQTNFTAQSLHVTGTNSAGSIGIDLVDTTGDATIIITDGGVISDVGTGVRLGISGSLAHSANAEFTFGGGSISGTASLDARGLNQTLGHYAFGSTTFSVPQLFDTQNVIFVGATATGLMDGSSLSDLASVTTADANTNADAIFVLVNNPTNTAIDASGGFSLSTGQTLASFGNGRSFSLGGVPINVTGDNVAHDEVVSDPTGGAATLTNSGAGAVVTAASGNSLQDFNISGGSAAGISASGVTGLTVQGVTVGGVATGLSLNNFTGPGTFTNFDVTSAGTGVSITGGTTGILTFDTASSIANTTGVAFNIDSSTPNLTYNGTINQTSAASAVKINAMTGGFATFGGKITASTGAANAIDLTNDTSTAIAFNGGLIINTTSGIGLNATNVSTLGISSAATNTITTTTGQAINIVGMDVASGGISFDSITTGVVTAQNALNLDTMGGGAVSLGAVTIGGAVGDAIRATSAVNHFTFDSIKIDGAGGDGVNLIGASIGTVDIGTVDIDGVAGNGIEIQNGVDHNVTIGGGTIGATTPAGGAAIRIEGQQASSTITLTNLAITAGSGGGLAISDSAGAIQMVGGTINNSGTGNGIVVSGGSAAITVSAPISSSATGLGTAVKVDGITGGTVAFSGNVTSTGTGNLFAIGTTTAPTGGTISFTGSALTASGGGGAVIGSLGAGAIFNATAPLSITNATGNGLSISNVAGSATFGAVTVSGAGGNGIDIAGNAGSVTFTGTTNVTLGSTANTAGINFSGTNADVSFGTTNVTMGAGGTQTGIDFSGSATTADFGLTTITGTGDLTSRGIDLSSTTGNKTITFLRGSSISNIGIGVDLSSGLSTATSANANFTFGDGTSVDGLQSSISAAAGGFTVNTIGLDPALGNYNFNDVFFTGNANLALAAVGTIMISQNGGVITTGTNGLTADVATVTAAQADAMVGTQSFAFVGTVDLSGTPFTLDAGQSIIGFGNGASLTTAGTIQPVNVQGNLGATGATVSGDEGVVKSTGSDTLHLIGGNTVKDTAFDFTGGSGSVFLIDSSAAAFDNTGGVVINGVTVSNVAVGQTAFKVDGATGTIGNVSITNNNINVAGTLLDANGGGGNITVTRGNLPNSGPAGTLTGGGISIANHTGGTVKFTDDVTIGGAGVTLTNNTGSTITFADLDVSTSGATAFTATGGGAINVTTGTVANSNGQAVALDGITANINFASTSATFSAGSGVDLQNLSGTVALGTGTLTNTGAGTAFNVGSATNASGGNADISYGGTIASNGTGAAVSIQELTGGSVTLSGNLTDGLADAGGNIIVTGIDNGTAATVTFSGSTKQIDSGAIDGVSLGITGNYPLGVPTLNTNGTVNFSNGGLAIKTTTGTGFVAAFGGTVSVSGTGPVTGNTIDSGSNGLVIGFADVGSAGVTFDNIKAVSTAGVGAGVLLEGVVLGGDVNIGGLKDTGYIGASLSGLSGTGVVNFTGTIDLDTSYEGFEIVGPQITTVNIANVAGSTLTIDGSQIGITQTSQGGTVNVGVNGSASITNTTVAALSLGGGNDLAFTTLTYNGSITIGAGSVISASGDGTRLNMSGSVVSTTSSTAFDFFGHADGIYDISSTIDHSGGTGVSIGGSANGTVTFSGTSKIFNTGANDAIVKAPAYVPDPQTKGTLNFTNGGLVITTTSGAGFTASTFGPGTVSVTGDGNTITTGTGTALKLGDATAVLAGATGATVGVDGIKFDTISTNGAATGISLNDVSGGALDLGAVNLEGITSRGVDVSGTLGSAVDFTSLKVGLNAANAVGLDLNGAALGTSNITAGDFDVDGGSFAGTIGIDMAGTTGTGTIQLGDTVNNNSGGQTSTIANVGYGVQFSSATNAKLVFGDGQGPAESSIATTGGQVIHATDSLPTNGDYNFNDVTFSGDTANLSSISVYYVDRDGNISGTGDGSLANPGSLAQAQASTANVVVLIDKNTGGTQETLDLSGGTFSVDDGQVLLAFKSGDAAVDVSQLGVDTSGGASAAFHFTTVQNSPIISAPGGIDTLRPVLQSNTAGSVVNFATSGTGLVTGGIQNLIIRNTGSGTGVAVTATAASSFFLRNDDIAAGGRALDFSTTGAPANTLLLSIDGNTLQSTGSALAASFSGQNISATDNSIAIRSFAGNKVIGGTGGGIAFNNVCFDSDGAGGTVSAGSLGIGTPGARVQGNGLSFTNTSGTLDLGTLSLANNGGTGVIANTKTTTFTLNTSAGVVTTSNGTAFDLDPLTVNMTFSSVTANGGASGIIFDGVAGTFTVTGATSITNTTGFGISAINTNTGTFNFNTVTVNNVTTPNTGGGIGWASGTLNISGLANIDTTSGAGLSQTGGTTGFTGGVTIDTTSGDGMLVINGSAITVTGATNTVTTATGRVVSMQTATIGASGVTFGTLKATGTVSGPGVQLSGVSGGIFNGGNVSIAGSSNNAITVQNATSSTVNFASATISGANVNGIDINGGVTGTVTFGTVAIDNTGASGVRLLNTSGTVNINGGSIGASNDPAGIGVEVSGGAATLNVAASLTKTSAGKIVDISGVTGGTVTLSGALTANTASDNGIFVHANTGGTFNFNGAMTLSTGVNTAVNLATNAGATINFAGGMAITTTSGLGFGATGGGTINVTGTNTINTSSGQFLVWNGMTVGASGATFSTMTAINTITGGDAVNLTNVGGGVFNGGTLSAVTGTNSNGIFLNGTGATVNFAKVTIKDQAGSASGGGIRIDNNTGAVTVGDNTSAIGGAGGFGSVKGIGIDINGGSGDITIAASVSKGSAANNVVQITGRTAGTVTLSGTLSTNGDVNNGINVNTNTGGTIIFSGAGSTLTSVTNTAVSLVNNTGATINFTGGGLAINTTTATAFNATGGGTVNVTGTGNTIASTTGTALNVINTDIGASGLTFQSISSNGAVNGIVLNNTGTSGGGLTVTGIGTTASSGGTITNSTGDGVSLTSTQNVSLTNMNITNSQGNGILGNSVKGLVLNRDTVSGNGNSSAGNGEGNIYLFELTGDATHLTTFNNLTVSNAYVHNVFIQNTGGTLADLVVTNSTFSNNGASTHAGDQFQIDLTTGGLAGTPTATVHATHNTFSGNLATPATFTATGFAGSVDDGTLNVHLGDGTAGGLNTFDTNDSGITLSSSNAGSLNFDVNDNLVTHNRAVGIAINHFGTGNVTGFLRNTTVGTQGDVHSGSEIGNGVDIHDESTSGTVTLSVTNNIVQSVGDGAGSGFEGIDVQMGNGAQNSATTMNITLTGNTIRDILDDRGLFINNFDIAGSSVINALVSGNTFTNANAGGGTTTARVGGAPGGTDKVNVTQADANALAAANGLTAGAAPGNTMRVDTNVVFSHAAPALPPPTP
ncbi:beta strand repeat-containing protein [Mesorhizobium loti]|uniref:S-layer family protein n=1 Tax=Mesorhizobium loti R88b TaxID=935548 RepID=A0A6M7WFY4_RHILI|nr:S-layer family protein [Mesorhizobium loti]QKD00977.1 S-layer family protein [Mesorhizobium loti R88b]